MNHKIRCNENKCEKFSEPKNDKVQPDIFMVIILTIFLTSTAIGQRKVVMKNATDCPMKVCYDDYDLSFESGSYYLSIWTVN